MSVEPRNLRTKAEEAIAAEYHARRESLPGGRNALARRDAAFAAFVGAGLPHRRVEAWKYTDLRALLRTFPPLSGEAPAALVAEVAERDLLAGVDRARIVTVNGRYRPDLSDLKQRIDWCLANDDECRQIAERSKRMARAVFDVRAAEQDTKALLGPLLGLDG